MTTSNGPSSSRFRPLEDAEARMRERNGGDNEQVTEIQALSTTPSLAGRHAETPLEREREVN